MLHESVPIQHGAKTKNKIMAAVFAIMTVALGVFGFAKPAMAYTDVVADLDFYMDFIDGQGGKAPAVDLTYKFEYQAVDGQPDPSVTSFTKTINTGTDLTYNYYQEKIRVSFTAPGTYTWKVSMVTPEGMGSSNRYDGIVYDTSVQTIQVVVTGNKTTSGEWDLYSPMTIGEARFKPSYYMVYTSVDIPITKTIKDGDWSESDSFTFNIEKVSSLSDQMTDNITVESTTLDINKKSGVIGGLNSGPDYGGTTVYKISEVVDGTDPNMKYADPVFVKVVWKLDDKAHQYTVLYYSADGTNWDELNGSIEFVNTKLNTTVPDKDLSEGDEEFTDPTKGTEDTPETTPREDGDDTTPGTDVDKDETSDDPEKEATNEPVDTTSGDPDKATTDDPEKDSSTEDPKDESDTEDKKDADTPDDKSKDEVMKDTEDKSKDTDAKTPSTDKKVVAKKTVKASTTKKSATPKTADATMVEAIAAIAASGAALLGTGIVLNKKRTK